MSPRLIQPPSPSCHSWSKSLTLQSLLALWKLTCVDPPESTYDLPGSGWASCGCCASSNPAA
eukprot:6985926-Karenia_brevis.AAC.1